MKGLHVDDGRACVFRKVLRDLVFVFPVLFSDDIRSLTNPNPFSQKLLSRIGDASERSSEVRIPRGQPLRRLMSGAANSFSVSRRDFPSEKF